MARILVLLLTASVLAGCNTVEGFGEDISSGARAIDRAI